MERYSGLVDKTVVMAGLILTGLGVTSVVLGWLGWMRPPLLVLFGGVVSAVLVIAGRRLPLPTATGKGAWLHLALVAVIGLLGIANASMSSEHLLVDSDPGIYANAARHLADEGTLLLEPREGPFDSLDSVERRGGGQYDVRDDGRIYFQFFHFLTGLMAIGGWIGGNLLLLRLPALIGMLSVVLFHLVARSFVPSGLAAALAVALALNPVQVFFSRDSFSETTSQMLVMLGLVILISGIKQADSMTFALAGVVLGATAFSRIDAVLITFPAALIALAMLHRADGAERRQGTAFLVAMLGVSSAGFAIGRWLSPVYWSHLSGLLNPMLILQGLLIVAGLGLFALRPLVQRVLSASIRERSWRFAGGLAGFGLLAGSVFALFLRPRVLLGHFGEERQLVANELAQVGLEPDATRNMAELSLQWITWYIGVPAVVLGLAGLALAVWHAIVRADRLLFAVAALIGVSLVVRVIRPSVVPVHYWSMRRFYVIIIPGLLLLAGWLITHIGQRLESRHLRVGLSAGLVVPTLAVIGVLQIDSWSHRQQIGLRSGVVEVLCEPGRDQAFLMLDHEGGVTSPSNYLTMFQTFCASPAARVTEPLSRPEASRLGEEWEQRGVQLILITAEVDRLRSLGVPECAISLAVSVNSQLPEATLVGPPRFTLTQVLPFHYSPALPDCE